MRRGKARASRNGGDGGKGGSSGKTGKTGYYVTPHDPRWLPVTILSALAVDLASAGIKKYFQHRQAKKAQALDNADNLAKDRETEEIDPETGLYLKKDQDASTEDDMAKINPNYSESDAFRTNCTMCTAAMELRQRGYDVAAGKTSYKQMVEGGLDESEYQSWFGDDESRAYIPEVNRKSTKDSHAYNLSVKKQMESGGEGARGELTVLWLDGSGHSMYYKVENGSAVVYDTQSNEKITGITMDRMLDATGAVRVRRLDNLTMNVDKMKESGAIS